MAQIWTTYGYPWVYETLTVEQPPAMTRTSVGQKAMAHAADFAAATALTNSQGEGTMVEPQ